MVMPGPVFDMPMTRELRVFLMLCSFWAHMTRYIMPVWVTTSSRIMQVPNGTRRFCVPLAVPFDYSVGARAMDNMLCSLGLSVPYMEQEELVLKPWDSKYFGILWVAFGPVTNVAAYWVDDNE